MLLSRCWLYFIYFYFLVYSDAVFSVTYILPHSDEVRCVAIGSVGTLIVSGSQDGWVRVWGLGKDEPIFSFEHGSPVDTVAFDFDGIHVFSHSLQFVKVWRMGKAKAVYERERPKNTDCVFSSAAFSRGGERIAIGYSSGLLEVCEWQREKPPLLFKHGEEVIRNLAFCPNSTELISCAGKTVKVWPLRNIPPDFIGFEVGFKVSDNEDLVELKFLQPSRTFEHGGDVCSVSISGNGRRLLVTSVDENFNEGLYPNVGIFTLWKLEAEDYMKKVLKFSTPSLVLSASLNYDGSIAAFTNEVDKGFSLCKTRKKGKLKGCWCRNVLALRPNKVCFSPDNKRVAVCGNQLLEKQNAGSVIVYYLKYLENHDECEKNRPDLSCN
ncbi:hypothetical protein [Endozoicomonas sp. Mp262]|uniref:WD40 repeat domain-containing protein n=1 Tax=Endozoicomonas sp. Mp262 TaxID=2919499 RepID=UPI0021D81582